MVASSRTADAVIFESQFTKELFARKYHIKDIVKGDSIFCATGITAGDIVKGINIEGGYYISETFITHKNTKTEKIHFQKNKINL